MKKIVSPSLLASNFAKLESEVKMIDNSYAEWHHWDVMDGKFVPNITFGMPVIAACRKFSDKIFDVHLMIENPENYVEEFRKAGADYITVHYEACNHLHRNVQQIKNTGAKAGVALNPHTSVNLLEDIIADLDLVLIMSVNPGFGGQKFIENTYGKVQKLKDLIIQKKSGALIEIDGGVNADNAAKLVASGADALVAGNFVFNSPNPTETIKSLYEIIN
jgi:ribulose-phosphate 3-epimerase